jgi:organic hydroperoxide reductase OsmC/OhrA
MQGMHTEVTVQHTRNEKGRLRIGKIDVQITPSIEEPDPQKLQRCLDMFEDFCVVTQSVRKGIDVSLTVQSPVG